MLLIMTSKHSWINESDNDNISKDSKMCYHLIWAHYWAEHLIENSAPCIFSSRVSKVNSFNS